MLKTIAIAAALVGGIAAPAAFSGKSGPAPAPSATTFQPKTAAAPKSFAATCTATESIDTRVEPEWVGQSFAKDGCVAPALPKNVDGYSAKRQDVLATMIAEKKYAIEADRYQQCILDYVTAKRTQAEKQKQTLNMALVVIENHRIAASEADKLRVSAQANETVRAYNEAGSEDCK